MKKIILGNSPLSSITGYVLAGLLAFDEATKTGETSWIKILITVAIAILGRVSADANKVQ